MKQTLKVLSLKTQWLIAVAAMLALHFGQWLYYCDQHQVSLVGRLSAWDSGWYNKIILEGYSGQSWAFLPLYPWFVKIFYTLYPQLPPQVWGTILSTLMFLLFAAVLFLFIGTGKWQKAGFVPSTSFGIFLFVFSPASYVFHSHHTESMFLLLSFAAFIACFYNRFWPASILAGLTALLRHQGVFVAIAVGFWLASNRKKGLAPTALKEKAMTFVGSGIISGLLFLVFPVYQYVVGGSWELNSLAHSQWEAGARSLGDVFRTFWFGNTWQNTNMGSIAHHIWYLAMLIAGVLFTVKHRVMGVYIMLSILVVLIQGELVGSFRYFTVLFPLLFWAGDKINNWVWQVKLPLALMYLYLNAYVALNYIKMRYPY